MNLLNILTPAQLAVFQAVEDAPNVCRPDNPDLKVGDTVVVHSSGTHRSTTVTKIGPKWITVGTGTSVVQFDRVTWRVAHGYGVGASLRTPEQADYDRRIAVAKSRLSAASLRVNYPADVSDGRILAIAALLDLLDEEA